MPETWLKCLVLSLGWTASALVARAPRPAMAAALRRSTKHDVAAIRTSRHDVALMAATLTDPTPATAEQDAAAVQPETTSAAPDYARFDWLDHWYPVAWTRDLPIDAVTKVTLFDVDYCVVNPGEREPRFTTQ